MAKKSGKKKPKISHRLEYGQGSFLYVESKKVWRGRLDISLDSHTKRRTVEVTSKDEDEAWRKFMELKRLYGNLSKSALAKTAATVDEWVTAWLKRREYAVRPKTYSAEKSALTTWILPKLGHRRLRNITGDDIRAIAIWQKEAGRSTTNARYTQRIFQQVLREAKADGYLIDDTALLAKIVKPAPNPREAITIEQATTLLNVASAQPDGSRWVAALMQGMRQGECLGLTWDCVDFEKKIIDVSWQLQELTYEDKEKDKILIPDGYEARRLYGTYHLVRPKTAHGQRLLPMVPWMEAALRMWQDYAPFSLWGLVWCHEDGTPINSKQDLAAWKRLQKDAGVCKSNGKPYVLHEARNTCATLLLEAGVDPEIIKAILGHSSIVTSRAYMRVNQTMTRAALEKVAARLQLGDGQEFLSA